MAADTTNDVLASAEAGQFQPGWDWKTNYISKLTEDGYERFSQYSATPDTTILYAGPARFTGLSGDASALIPIGLVDNISMQANPSLARLFEIGSNRSFFTRGKTAYAASFSKMLADQKNILAALTQASYQPANLIPTSPPGATEDADIQMNLDSETFAVPFGIMLLFKTKAGGTSGEGKILSAAYLESCMFSGYSFQIASASPVIVENIAFEYDRLLPVAVG